MTPERQKKIDRVSKISGDVMAFGFLVILIGGFLLLKIGIIILNRFGINVYEWDSYETAKQIYITFNWIIGGISTFAFITHITLKQWATDDEKEQRKNEIKEALREEQEAQAKKKRDYMPPRETPLIDLTEKQEGVVNSLLLDIPIVNGHLKTAELIQILRALAGQGDLDDSNKDELIYWVERVTGKDVDVRNFKYDYDTKYSDKGVTKWGDIIRAKFDKLENS